MPVVLVAAQRATSGQIFQCVEPLFDASIFWGVLSVPLWDFCTNRRVLQASAKVDNGSWVCNPKTPSSPFHLQLAGLGTHAESYPRLSFGDTANSRAVFWKWLELSSQIGSILDLLMLPIQIGALRYLPIHSRFLLI